MSLQLSPFESLELDLWLPGSKASTLSVIYCGGLVPDAWPPGKRENFDLIGTIGRHSWCDRKYVAGQIVGFSSGQGFV